MTVIAPYAAEKSPPQDFIKFARSNVKEFTKKIIIGRTGKKSLNTAEIIIGKQRRGNKMKMEIDKEKFCSDIVIGGYIEQILRVPRYDLLYDGSNDKPPVTDYILWDVRVPAGRNILGDLQSIFFVKIRGLALNAVRNIYSHDYVKIKGKVFAPGIMGGEKRFMTFFYSHWGDDRFEIVVDEPEQILAHEVMEVGSQNENHFWQEKL